MTRDLAAHYDAMWAAAAPVVRDGGAELDPWLSREAADPRRGVTLLARPDARVAARIAAMLDELRALEPEQRYQPPAEMHHTVLSLLSATPDHAEYLPRVEAYDAAIGEVTRSRAPFDLEVRGVTLSRGAVLAQGFPGDDTLHTMRDGLRDALAARGGGDTVDARYRLTTAHLTLVRFAVPLHDPARFVEALARFRDAAFGTSRVARVELVLSDYYHSAGRETLLRAYDLGAPSSADR